MKFGPKWAWTLAALLLLGAGCETSSYQTQQQPWSELTAEQRASIRSVMSGLWTYDALSAKTPDEIRAVEPLVIDVMARGNDILPFPETQFRPVTPEECPDDCPGMHFVGPEGLTLDLRRLDEPAASCEWGPQASTTEMEIDHEAFIRWLGEYRKTHP